MKNSRFILVSLGLALAGLFLPACSKKDSAKIDTGKELPAVLVEPQFQAYFPGQPVGQWAFTPDTSYAVVNSAWLPAFYARWRADIFDKGVTKWDGRYDCNKFAASFCAAAQLEYYRDKFHSWDKGQALAVGEIWYRPDVGGAHAIVAAVTERGVLFIEPQNGQEVKLSPKELAGIFFKRF
jgi:hypothetical protein